MKPVQWLAMVGLACVVGAFGPVTAGAAGHPDFSGKWAADFKASDFGPMGSPDKAGLTVTQKDPEISIHSELSVGGQSRDWEATCTTDAKPCKANNDMPVSLEWKGDALIVHRGVSFQGMDIKITETWTLSADGKTLTSDRAVETPQGNGTQKIVFTKQ